MNIKYKYQINQRIIHWWSWILEEHSTIANSRKEEKMRKKINLKLRNEYGNLC